MVSKSKSRKAKTKKPKQKSESKKAQTTTGRKTITLHKIQGDPHRLLKVEWHARRKEFVGTPVGLQEASHMTLSNNLPFCKNTLDDPSKKYYCEFSVQDNQYICSLVDADDPRCTH